MENPYEEQQVVLLSRIIGNVAKLNEAIGELTRSLSEINKHNENTAAITEMWANYNRNVRFNLESKNELKPPV